MTQNCIAAPALLIVAAIMAAMSAHMLITIGTWQEQLAGTPLNYHYRCCCCCCCYYYHYYYVDHDNDEWALASSHSRVLIWMSPASIHLSHVGH